MGEAKIGEERSRDRQRDVTGRVHFLLSPANLGGRRAGWLLRPEATFPLAVRLRESGLPIGDAYEFLSGLYFRGKLAYARRFATAGVLVIVPGHGLVPPERVFTRDQLIASAGVDVSPDEVGFRAPLERDAASLAAALESGDVVILLGSIATGKYVDLLEPHLGDRLHLPTEFVGRGNMSRGGLLLRCAASGESLRYEPIHGAARRGPRPPRLEPVR